MKITNVGTQTVTTNQTQAYANKEMQERGEHIDISGQMNDAVAVEISMEGTISMILMFLLSKKAEPVMQNIKSRL